MNDPKFQYSVFPNADRNEQYVVRADTIEDLKNQISQLKFSLSSTAVSTPTISAPTNDDLKAPCKKCGSETTYKTGFSKSTGKPWKGYFCPKDTKEDPHPPFWIK